MARRSPGPAGGVFISYRREETGYPAAWLYEQLRDRLGSEAVFKDVDNLDPGDDFVAEITAAVGGCDVLLALIGKDWATVTNADGGRRLDDPGDFVRIEIEVALSRDIRVIPVLLSEAQMPDPDQLPPSLSALTRRQAIELSPSRFNADAERLLVVVVRSVREISGARFGAQGGSAEEGRAQDGRDQDGAQWAGGAAFPTPSTPSGAAEGDVVSPRGTAGPPPAEAHSRRPLRRASIAAAVVCVFAAGAALAWSLTDRGPSSSPWRLVVEDLRQPDVGCSVTATNTGTGEKREFRDLYGTTSWQFQDEGSWRWEASSSQCRVTPRSGAGDAVLPYLRRAGLGDSDAFDVDGPVKVELLELYGGTECRIDLEAVDTGQTVDVGVLRTDSPTLVLDPKDSSPVFVANLTCTVRVSASG